MELNQWSTIFGIISFCLFALVILIVQKRFEREDFGQLGGAFFAGANIPPAFFLCIYGFLPAYKGELTHTNLAGYEKYISFARSHVSCS